MRASVLRARRHFCASSWSGGGLRPWPAGGHRAGSYRRREALREYFFATYGGEPGGLAAEPNAGGGIALGTNLQRRIRYCIGTGFGARAAETEHAMHAATRAWES